MGITNDIRLAHEKLSNASPRFLDFVEKNPGALMRSNFNTLEGKDDVGKLQPWPAFVNQHTRNQMEEACVNVFNLIKRIPGLIFAGEGTFIFCDYPHLHVVDGHLFHKNKKIHALIEMYHGVIPDMILNVFKLVNVCLYNGPITKLLSNKLNLTLLSQHEDSDTFSLQENEIIKKYIPLAD